jgi:alginate O-acetyltransferase complex protein AlgI
MFLVFFPVVVAGLFALPYSARWAWLLLASCFFYMVFVPQYILILAFTIGVDYVAGRMMTRTAPGRLRKGILLASIGANLGVLFFFKYFNFASGNIAWLAAMLHWNYPLAALRIALPIGLSFHVFQSLAYTIEVYRGKQTAERHLGILALYVMFFPQLVAGPIERPQNLLHQFHERRDFDSERAISGLKRMLWGFFKKCVIADRLALLVSPVFADPRHFSGPVLAAALLFFTFQIYCDFSGYADIAVGSARVMGFDLMENFHQPYASASVAEFWTRWHRSLSTWFRDYMYIPLGGNRVGHDRWQANIVAVFLASGLWHGANWTFLVWGGLHAVYVLGERASIQLRANLARAVGLVHFPRVLHGLAVARTFALVAVAWLFFRAATVSDASYMLTHLLSGILGGTGYWPIPFESVDVALAATGIAVMLAFEPRGEAQLRRSATVAEASPTHFWGWHSPSQWPRWTHWLAYQALAWAVVFLGVFQNQAFIYFQF